MKKWIDTPKELYTMLDNPISAEYLEIFTTLLGYNNDKTKVNPHERPMCILIVGARGAGKTTITNYLQTYLPNIDLSKFGSFDGDILRHNYKPYRDLMTSPERYKDAWDILKPHIDEAKYKILHNKVLPEKRNIIIASSVEKSDDYYDLFKNNGYDIAVVGISVKNWNEILNRGLIRAETTGRPYIGTKELWEKCQQWIENISQRKEIVTCVVIDNSDYKNPSIMYSKIQ